MYREIRRGSIDMLRRKYQNRSLTLMASKHGTVKGIESETFMRKTSKKQCTWKEKLVPKKTAGEKEMQKRVEKLRKKTYF